MQATKKFAELEDLLNHLHAPVGAAECHGFVCAQLCVNRQADFNAWRACLGGEGDEFESMLARISDVTARGLEAEDFSFELMLPSEEATVAVRANALTQWCRGFLFGLGSSGLTDAGLTGECRELVEDMERVSRARAELEDGEEFALMELIEFVRIGALSIYHELLPMRTRTQDSMSLH